MLLTISNLKLYLNMTIPNALPYSSSYIVLNYDTSGFENSATRYQKTTDSH